MQEMKNRQQILSKDIFFLRQKGADESIVRGDASSSEPFSRLTTWLSGDRRLGAAWETLGGTLTRFFRKFAGQTCPPALAG